MSYIALYRKWRPLVFEDVVEQEHVVKTLKNSVVTGRIAHAYLFCGTRGTGKTTMAKIFSRAINCLNPLNGDPCNECEICKGVLSGNILDVVEIDAASNNSVDNVREIRDEVIYAPSQAKYKVYIIDEVHMLSSGAFNALLKTLEEPPSHVVFVLATTEPHKLPATILSRCQRFDFRRITVDSIVERLNEIVKANSILIQSEAARLIARMAEGALRDAISILDQCISIGSSEITYDNVLTVVGVVNDTFVGDVVDAINERDINRILEQVDVLVMDGKDITQFVSDVVYYYRNVLICKITGRSEEVIEASKESIERMKKQGANLDQEEIIYIIKELSLLESGLKWATHPRILLEVSLIKVCEHSQNAVSGNIMDRLAALEKSLSSGDFVSRIAPKAGSGASTVEERTFKENSLVSHVAPVSYVTPAKKTLSVAETPAGGGVGSVKSLASWNEILNELKSMGRMALYTNLLNTKAVEIDNKIVGIVFSTRGGLGRMLASKPENLEVLESVVGKKLGREVKIKCVDEDDVKGGGKEEQKAEKDEFIEKARDIANRSGVPLNIIDE